MTQVFLKSAVDFINTTSNLRTIFNHIIFFCFSSVISCRNPNEKDMYLFIWPHWNPSKKFLLSAVFAFLVEYCTYWFIFWNEGTNHASSCGVPCGLHSAHWNTFSWFTSRKHLNIYMFWQNWIFLEYKKSQSAELWGLIFPLSKCWRLTLIDLKQSRWW